jgi:hypothetical protein
MERYNANEDGSLFAQEEQQRYFDVLSVLSKKIEIADGKFGGVVDTIEMNGGIPANLTEKLLLWPIEEIDEVIKSLLIEKNNMPFALALRDALVEKINNLVL